jgi:hypothetical protein
VNGIDSQGNDDVSVYVTTSLDSPDPRHLPPTVNARRVLSERLRAGVGEVGQE